MEIFLADMISTEHVLLVVDVSNYFSNSSITYHSKSNYIWITGIQHIAILYKMPKY